MRDFVLRSSNHDEHHCNNTHWVACGQQVQMTLQHYDEMTDSFGFSEHQCDVDDDGQTQSVDFALTNPGFPLDLGRPNPVFNLTAIAE